MDQYFLIGDVSKLINIPTSALRFYDRKGIISPEIKGENGYRYYSKKQLFLLKEIKIMRNLKIPLSEIKKILNKQNENDITKIFQSVLKSITEEIEALEDIKKNILEDMENYSKNYNLQLNTPFLEYCNEKRGVHLFEITDEKDEVKLIKKLEKLETINGKIINSHTIKIINNTSFEKSDKTAYAILNNELQNTELIAEKGRYLSIYEKGEVFSKNNFDILNNYIAENNLKRKDENVYIDFHTSILSWKMEDVFFKMSILLEE